MKGFLIFIIICGLTFSGVMWFTKTGLPKYHQKKLNEAALRIIKDKHHFPRNMREVMNNVQVPNLGGWLETIKPPYHGSWVLDEDDEKQPVKIYHWMYYTCPKDKTEIPVKTSVRPAQIKCPKCGTTYMVEDDNLHKEKDNKSVINE